MKITNCDRITDTEPVIRITGLIIQLLYESLKIETLTHSL